MNTDLLTILRERYPEPFSSQSLREIECLPGWPQLLDDLCHPFRKYSANHPQAPRISATRVKEEVGELRFYSNGGGRYCREIVDHAVAASLEIFEVCGLKGELVSWWLGGRALP